VLLLPHDSQARKDSKMKKRSPRCFGIWR